MTRRQLIPLLAAFAPALASLAQPTDLRGPGYGVDDTFDTVADVQTQPGELELTMQGQILEGTFATQQHTRIRIHILRIDDGQVTQVNTTILENTQSTDTVIREQEQHQEQGEEMEQTSFIQTLTPQGWQTDVQSEVLPDQAKDLLREAPYVDPHGLFPEQPVEPGYEWQVEGPVLASLMSNSVLPGAAVDGTVTMRFVEIRVVDGRELAVIEFDLDGTITTSTSQIGSDITVQTQMLAAGTLLRDLSTYTNDITSEGALVMNMSMQQAGVVELEMTAQMPMTTHTAEGPPEDPAEDPTEDPADQ